MLLALFVLYYVCYVGARVSSSIERLVAEDLPYVLLYASSRSAIIFAAIWCGCWCVLLRVVAYSCVSLRVAA